MSVYNIESDVYIGYTGNAITALNGNSGTLLANLVGRSFRAQLGGQSVLRRHGLGPDQITSLSRGPSRPYIALQPRDVSAATLALLFSILTNLETGAVATSGANVVTVGTVSPTIQIWGASITGASDEQVYAPACAIAPSSLPSVLTWARDVSKYDGQEVLFVATRPDGQTTPAMATGTNTQLGALYFG